MLHRNPNYEFTTGADKLLRAREQPVNHDDAIELREAYRRRHGDKMIPATHLTDTTNSLVSGFIKSSTNVFFEPTPDFWRTMRTPYFQYRRVRDFGCGMGTLVQAFRNYGWQDAKGYDKFVRESAVVDVVEMDVIADASEIIRPKSLDEDTLEWVGGIGESDLIIIARPHSPEFVEQIADEYLYHGWPSIFVITHKPERLGNTVHRTWPPDEEPVVVGQDGELLYQILGPDKDNDDLMDAVKDPHGYGMHPHSGGGLLNGDESCQDAWIDRQGRIYRVAYSKHRELLELYFHIDDHRAEELGWVRTHGPSSWMKSEPFYSFNAREKNIRLTKRQIRALESMNFDVHDMDVLDDFEMPTLVTPKNLGG